VARRRFLKMKLFSVSLFFAVFIVFNAITQILDLNSMLRGFFASTSAAFACGFPSTNIPALDPAFVSQFSTTLNQIGAYTSVQMNLSNITVTGLSNFNITSVSASFLTLSVTFAVTQPMLQLSGKHTTTVTTSANVVFVGTGDFSFTPSNISTTVTINFNLYPFGISSHTTTSLSVNSVGANFTGFSPTSRNTQVSNNLSNGAPSWLANNLAQVNTAFANFIVPYANARLSMFASLDNLISIIQSSGAFGC